MSLVLFTTGIYAKSYDRVFVPVGCMVGDFVHKVSRVEWEMVTCEVERGELREGVNVSVVLKKDNALQRAMRGREKLHGEVFEFSKGDIADVRENELSFAPGIEQELEKNGGNGLAFIGKGLLWRNEYLEKASKSGVRYELCLMTLMKQYPFLLRRWVEYYRKVGVDRFYIFDNGASQDLGDVFQGMENVVETVFWPWPRSQMQSNNYFLLAGEARCRWIAFFDADEFVMVGGGRHKEGLLKSYLRLKENGGYRQIAFHFIEMINSGYVRRPQGDLPELYTRRAEVQRMQSAKVVINTDTKWDHHRIHIVTGNRGRRYWNQTLELKPRSIHDNAMLVHYTRRSWEDFVAKNQVGGSSVLTSGRPRKVLDVSKPDEKYMSEKGVEYVEFRERWRRIMKRRDDGRVQVSWKQPGGIECRMWICEKCWWRWGGGYKECEDIK